MKKVDKLLNGLAKQLPEQKYFIKQKEIVKGVDVIARNKDVPPNIEIDPAKDYIGHKPVVKIINHKRRIRKVYKSNGVKGVLDYISPMLQDEHREGVLHGIAQEFFKLKLK